MLTSLSIQDVRIQPHLLCQLILSVLSMYVPPSRRVLAIVPEDIHLPWSNEFCNYDCLELAWLQCQVAVLGVDDDIWTRRSNFYWIVLHYVLIRSWCHYFELSFFLDFSSRHWSWSHREGFAGKRATISTVLVDLPSMSISLSFSDKDCSTILPQELFPTPSSNGNISTSPPKLRMHSTNVTRHPEVRSLSGSAIRMYPPWVGCTSLWSLLASDSIEDG